MKKAIITIVIIIIIIICACFYFLSGSNSTPVQAQSAVNTAAMNSANSSESVKATIPDKAKTENTSTHVEKTKANVDNSNTSQTTSNTSTSNVSPVVKPTTKTEATLNSSVNTNNSSSNNNNNTVKQNTNTNTSANNIKPSSSNTTANNANNNPGQGQLPSDLSTIDVPAGQDYMLLGNMAHHLGMPVPVLREIVYNSIKNKIPNSGYVNLTEDQQNILLKGTTAQKEALVKELGPNKLLINITFNTNLPTNNSQYPVYPENFANGKFYYSFLAAPLSKMAESVNNWGTYSGMVDKSGNLLSVDEYNKLCTTRSIYALNLNSGIPSYPEANEINI